MIRERHPTLDRDTFLYQCIRVLIDTFIRDLVQEPKNGFLIAVSTDRRDNTVRRASGRLFTSHAAMEGTAQSFPSFEFLHTPQDTENAIQSRSPAQDLFREYVGRPSQLPPGVHKKILENQDSPERIVCDYISRMTDRLPSTSTEAIPAV